jgi:hypothetical protein
MVKFIEKIPKGEDVKGIYNKACTTKSEAAYVASLPVRRFTDMVGSVAKWMGY